jgi:putative peptidoglycan lipid II flippase
VRQMLLLLVPAAALMMVLSDPITRIVYQRGEFDAAQTDLVSEALFFFALSLPFAGINLILIRTFFSLQSPWTPTLIALGNLGVNAGLDALLYKPMGIGGIPLATAIVSLITTVALALVLRGRLGGLDLARTLDASIRVLVAGALLVAVTLGVREALSGLSDSLIDQIVVVAAASVAGLTVYASVVLATRVEEARQISALIRGQLARLR